jgi:hypothetical protein
MEEHRWSVKLYYSILLHFSLSAYYSQSDMQPHVPLNLLTLKVHYMFRPIWPSWGVKIFLMRKLLSSVVNICWSLRWACVYVTCVNFLLEFIYAKFSMCCVITYLCTYWRTLHTWILIENSHMLQSHKRIKGTCIYINSRRQQLPHQKDFNTWWWPYWLKLVVNFWTFKLLKLTSFVGRGVACKTE